MTGKELFLEIGNIREEYVTEAENYRARTGGSILVGWNRKVASSPAFRKILATAACLVVCAGIVFTVQKLGISHDTAKKSAMENQMVMESAQEEMLDVYEKKEDTGPETGASIAPEAAEEANGLIDELKTEGAEEESMAAEKEEMQSEKDSEKLIGEAAGESGETESDIVWDADSVKKRMNSYPDEYEEILKLEGVFVLVHGKAEKGQTVWETFLKSVDAGETAQAEIVRFTVEGDPIIETVFYDGREFYLCVDNSRDAYRGKEDAYFEAKYSSLEKVEKTLETGGRTIEYSLSDGKNEYSIVYIEE